MKWFFEKYHLGNGGVWIGMLGGLIEYGTNGEETDFCAFGTTIYSRKRVHNALDVRHLWGAVTQTTVGAVCMIRVFGHVVYRRVGDRCNLLGMTWGIGE